MNQKTAKLIARIIAIIIVVALVVTTFSYLMVFAGIEEPVYGAEETEYSEYANDAAYMQQEMFNLMILMQSIHELFKDNVDYQKITQGAYQGMMDALNDPYSVYYEKETGEGEAFVQSVSGEYGGIGIQLEEIGKDYCRIVSVFGESPAEKAGLKAGDLITAVDGESVKGKTSSVVSSKLKGEKNTWVSISVSRNGQDLTFKVMRATISLESVSSEMMEGNIGYVRISQFDVDSHEEFEKDWADLQEKGAEALIIDLRDNGGGYVDTAVAIADQLIEEGPIVYFAKRSAIYESEFASGEGGCDVPIYVLINENTASSSEILAAALRDSAGAKLVGTTSFGKGISQNVWTLTNGDTLKLSTSYFLTPKKEMIDKVGLTPDHMVQNYNLVNKQDLLDAYESFAPFAETRGYSADQAGLNVYALQQRLDFLGYELEAYTGIMDKETLTAFKAFQKDKKVFIDGYLDREMRELVETACQEVIFGVESDRDLQLEKALELLK